MVIDVVNKIFLSTAAAYLFVRLSEVIHGEVVLLQKLNYEIMFLDIPQLTELVCDTPHKMEEEVRWARARVNMLRWTRKGVMEN